ncbi:MAG TPA: hypothetical protein P5164_17860 [Thermoanaerobaculia bacterium]|nr:hypothetical protein [Thermoanaerobaculia bacterium]
MAWVASFFLVGFLAGSLRAGFGSGFAAGLEAGALRASAAGFAASALRAGAFRLTRRIGAVSFGAFAPGVTAAAGSACRAGTASGALFGVLGPAFVFRGPGPSFSFFRFDFSSMVLVPFGS